LTIWNYLPIEGKILLSGYSRESFNHKGRK
jgi:hypothetical protein